MFRFVMVVILAIREAGGYRTPAMSTGSGDIANRIIVILCNQCCQDRQNSIRPRRPLTDLIGILGIRLISPKLQLLPHNTDHEQRRTDKYDGAGNQVIESCKCPHDPFMRASEPASLRYRVFHVERDIDQIANLSRISPTKECCDEALQHYER